MKRFQFSRFIFRATFVCTYSAATRDVLQCKIIQESILFLCSFEWRKTSNRTVDAVTFRYLYFSLELVEPPTTRSWSLTDSYDIELYDGLLLFLLALWPLYSDHVFKLLLFHLQLRVWFKNSNSSIRSHTIIFLVPNNDFIVIKIKNPFDVKHRTYRQKFQQSNRFFSSFVSSKFPWNGRALQNNGITVPPSSIPFTTLPNL